MHAIDKYCETVLEIYENPEDDDIDTYENI